MAAKIKKGDKVFIIAGKDKGKEGEVLRVLDNNKAIINDGNQCSRRKKFGNFCGKHKKKQPFGIVSDININSEAIDFIIKYNALDAQINFQY